MKATLGVVTLLQKLWCDFTEIRCFFFDAIVGGKWEKRREALVWDWMECKFNFIRCMVVLCDDKMER